MRPAYTYSRNQRLRMRGCAPDDNGELPPADELLHKSFSAIGKHIVQCGIQLFRTRDDMNADA